MRHFPFLKIDNRLPDEGQRILLVDPRQEGVMVAVWDDSMEANYYDYLWIPFPLKEIKAQ